MIAKILDKLELIKVLIAYKLCGLNYIVSYLRNPNPRITINLLRRFNAKIGEKTSIKRSIVIDNSLEDQNSTGDFSNIIIGNNCYIGDGVFFDLANKIIIEDDSVISAEVSLITHSDCNRSAVLNKKFPRECNPIIVRNGSWIGAGATILNGITIGQYSVVAAGALILKSTEPNTLYGGIPAKKLRNL